MTEMASRRKHPVVEVFGPTLQGEGELVGTPVYFVRFGGCDYSCSWCDSKFAVIPSEVRKNAEHKTPLQITDEIDAMPGGADWIVFSGGNPALQHLDALVDELHLRGYRITVETQGTFKRDWLYKADHVTVSPKPPSSGNTTNIETLRDFLLHPSPLDRVSIKMVVFDEGDLDYAREVARWADGLWTVYLSVGNNVGKDGREDLLDRCSWIASRSLQDPDLARVRVLPQLHVLLYGNARGV